MINEPRRDTSGLGDALREDPVLSVGDLFRAVRRRLAIILLAMVVCVSLAVGYSLMQTPLYQASIQILVGQNQGLMQDPSQAINLQNAAITFSEAVASRPVGERVVNSLNLKESPDYIAAGTSAEVVNGTQFIEVTYTADDPRDAQRIANEIGDAFSAQVSEVSPEVNGVSATVWESADLPQAPISPKPLRNGLIGFVVGGMLGVGLALLREHLDDRWQSPEEAEHVSGAPTLGIVPRFESPKAEKG